MERTSVCYICIAVCCLVSQVSTANVAVQKGQDATLACSYSDNARIWKKGSEQIADKDFAGNAKYELTGTDFNLKVKGTEDSDAALFTCEETPDGTATLARLLIIATYSCNLENEGTTQVKFSCTATTDGHGSAGFQFDVNSGGYDTSANTGTTAAMQRNVIRTAADAETLSCKIKYSAVPGGPATADPSFVPTGYDVCTKISATPAGVTITPSGAAFDEGDTLTCTATGNPAPTIQWLDGTDSLPSENGVLTLTTDMAGKTLKCTASNNINTAELEREVTSVAATTAVPTTVPVNNGDSTVPQTDDTTSSENLADRPNIHGFVVALTFVSNLF